MAAKSVYFLGLLNNIFGSVLSLVQRPTKAEIKKSNSLTHLLHPLIPVIRTKFPGCKIVFNIAKHHIPFLRGIAVFHNQGAAQFYNNIQRR